MRAALFAIVVALLASACGTPSGSVPTPPPCEAECKDEVALLGLRNMMKLAFNLTLQGKPVGPQDVSAPCPFGGSVRISGDVTSDAAQGATNVDLTYVFDQCAYEEKDDEAEENFSLVVTGSITQRGIFAVQPTSTNAVVMKSDAPVTVTGTVYDPALDYAETCLLQMGQNGNTLTGKICDRTVSVDL